MTSNFLLQLLVSVCSRFRTNSCLWKEKQFRKTSYLKNIIEKTRNSHLGHI